MIRGIVAWIRDRRIRRQHERVRMFAMAAMVARINGDTPAQRDFEQHLNLERVKRDVLLAKQPHCCNHDCDEGRRCPARH